MDSQSSEPIHMDEEPNTRPVSKRQAQARLELEQALSFHLRGEKASALKSFRKALKLYPDLENERLVQNLAHELTDLPAREAVKSLAGEQSSKEMVQTARHEQERPPISFRQRFMTAALVVALLALIGISIRALQVRSLDSYLTSIRAITWETQKHTMNGYEYYAIVPSGPAPSDGWPVVVALHGMNGKASHMLSFAQSFLDEGVLFIAPSFGDYAPWPKGPIDVLSHILKEVDKDHPLQARGAVLLGHSQGGTFAYRFSVYYPDQVAGVVTAGAPEFDLVYPTRATMPYILTWGEYDWLQEYTFPTAFALKNSGYNVRVFVVPKAEHEMTRFAVDKALGLLVGE